MIPDFNKNGNLPPGIHYATIEQVLERYNRPRYGARLTCSTSLKLFFSIVIKFAMGFYINGSYITSKIAPSDIDIALVLPDDIGYDSDYVRQLNRLEKERKDLHVFPYRVNGDSARLHNMVEFWCRDRDGNPKGIIYVEIKSHD